MQSCSRLARRFSIREMADKSGETTVEVSARHLSRIDLSFPAANVGFLGRSLVVCAAAVVAPIAIHTAVAMMLHAAFMIASL